LITHCEVLRLVPNVRSIAGIATDKAVMSLATTKTASAMAAIPR